MDPTATDISVLHKLEDWVWYLLTGGFIGTFALVWRASAERAKTLSTSGLHHDRLERHEARLGDLEKGQQNILIKLAELPTRTEHAAQSARMEERFDRIERKYEHTQVRTHIGE